MLLAMIIIAMAFAQTYRKIRRLDLATFSSRIEKIRISMLFLSKLVDKVPLKRLADEFRPGRGAAALEEE